jgi:hypothetical protein
MKAATPPPEPVVRELRVRIPVAEASAHFTRDIGRWWPLRSHSCSLEPDARLSSTGALAAR